MGTCFRSRFINNFRKRRCSIFRVLEEILSGAATAPLKNIGINIYYINYVHAFPFKSDGALLKKIFYLLR